MNDRDEADDVSREALETVRDLCRELSDTRAALGAAAARVAELALLVQEQQATNERLQALNAAALAERDEARAGCAYPGVTR